jgi:methylated-DNA-[protein]-cysteine S-methyltransferase
MQAHLTKSTTAEFKRQVLQGRVLAGMSFEERVWAVCARVPRGKVTTYAAIARALGGRAYRAVGAALGRNPYAPQVPCHRVVGSNGALTGFAGGLPAKRDLLEREGVRVRNGKVDLEVFGVSATGREIGFQAALSAERSM